MKIEEIIKQPEGRRLEFKEALPFSYKETHYEQLRTITNKYIKILLNPILISKSYSKS